MKKVIALLTIVFCFFAAHAQQQGIGLRLGTPWGITYKKYLDKRRAFEFGLGSSSSHWSHRYYRNSFNDYGPYDHYRYRSHAVESTVYLQGRYLLHNNIYVEGLEGNWDWYWGVGAVLKVARVKYRFDNDAPPFNESGVYRDVDLGPEAIIGMEYTFQDVPLSVFADLSLMLEIVDRVTLQPLSGVGARYRF
jgi:hypothetical protein